MDIDRDKRALRNEWLLAFSMIAAGLLITALSLAEIKASARVHTAQATQPLQGTPVPEESKTPSPSTPGGSRPTTPAPEPARPDQEAQGTAAKPALPPAPAEKIAPPIKDKQ